MSRRARNIHQLFKPEFSEPIRRATIERGRSQICWYPSAGDDYRHISFLEHEALRNGGQSPPLVYLHSDVHIHEDGPNHPTELPGFPFGHGQRLGRGLFVDSVVQVEMKKPVRHCSEIFCCDPFEHAGKAFFAELRLDFELHGRRVFMLIPLIYVISENLAFMVNALLFRRVKVNTLVHIRDGGASLGGSRIPMHFIYHVAQLLRIKRVISEWSSESFCGYLDESYRLLKKEINQLEQNIIAELGDRYISLLSRFSDQSGEEISNFWDSTPIPSRRYGANWWTFRGQSYYDWRPSGRPALKKGDLNAWHIKYPE